MLYHERSNIITRRAIQEKWCIGPHDYCNSIAFYPKSYHIVGEKAVHIRMTEFPKHNFFMVAE